VREALIGKLVDFTIEYQINGKKYISILQEESSVTFNFLLVQQGLAKAIEKKATGRLYELIRTASQECQEQQRGVWSEGHSHVRQVIFPGD
jgi:endonuclease YncB( thermonuclease family)